MITTSLTWSFWPELSEGKDIEIEYETYIKFPYNNNYI